MRTAGRTVAFTAATVSAALITLTVFPLGFLAVDGHRRRAVVAVVAGGRRARDLARAVRPLGREARRGAGAGAPESEGALVPALARA